MKILQRINTNLKDRTGRQLIVRNMNRLILLLFISVLLGCAESPTEEATVDPDKILAQNVTKIKTSLKLGTVDNGFPRNIPKGQTTWKTVGVKDWCSGFYPGVLWYAYEYSGDQSIKKSAEDFTAPLRSIAFSPAENHDIGFIVYCSYGNGYRLTGNEDYKKVLLSAADTLATLYNPAVGSIISWPSQKQFRHNTIIDNMMNLELLFWAAENGGSQNLYNIAESHAEVTMKNLLRPDNSLFHVGTFNEETGAFIKAVTHQGYADNSMWARGQAWGIYGFSIAHRETGRTDFLETAVKVSDQYLKRLPEDGIPFWDFDAPNIPEAPKDASAAAIAACGLLELSSLVDDGALAQKYTEAAKRLIAKLSSKKYLSGDVNEALLLHSTGHYPKSSEIDIPIVYGDYYYMEALLRLKKVEEKAEADRFVKG